MCGGGDCVVERGVSGGSGGLFYFFVLSVVPFGGGFTPVGFEVFFHGLAGRCFSFGGESFTREGGEVVGVLPGAEVVEGCGVAVEERVLSFLLSETYGVGHHR